MISPISLAVARLVGPRGAASAAGGDRPADGTRGAGRDTEGPAWHAELTPGRLVAGLFDAGSPLAHGLSRQSRRALQEGARDVASAPLTAREREDLLAFVANSEAVLGDGRRTQGMASPRACWLMFCALASSVDVAKTPAERSAMVDMMRTYRVFFASSLINAHFRGRPDGRAEHAAVQPHLVAAALSPGRAGVLHSGYLGHTTLTRLAVVPAEGDGEVPAGSRLARYREQAAAALGPAAAPALAGSFQLGLRPEDLRRPAIQALITATHALVHPSGRAGTVNITRRLAGGATRTSACPIAEALPYLAGHGLMPTGNGIKVTIHNGGSGARVGPDGDTRSYDQRLLIPVAEAETALAPLLGAKLDDRDVARVAIDGASVWDAEAHLSVARSPAMAGQTLGNCTIHSQKLCILYHLQHMREAGDSQALSAAGGAGLFARLWTRVYARVLEGCEDPQVRRRGGRAGGRLDAQMATMLTVGERTAGHAVRAAPRPPAKHGRRPLAPRDGAAASTPLVPPVPPVSRVPRSRPATPPALATFGASPAGPPPAALVAWMHQIAGSAWTPATVDEATAFTRLRDHLVANAPGRQERHALTFPLAGGDTFARGRDAAAAFLTAPDAGHPALAELRDALFVWQFDAGLIQRATPRKLLQAWQAAAAIDPLTAHLLPDAYRARPPGGR